MQIENLSITRYSLDSKTFAGQPTRETNGIILERLWKACPSLCGGGADLVNSNKIVYSENDVFGPATSFKGRYIRNGIREHAMASIANGMAAYGPGTFLPITATFFMFFIYVSISSIQSSMHKLVTNSNKNSATIKVHAC
jgi:dihydroxyacetone synthase